MSRRAVLLSVLLWVACRQSPPPAPALVPPVARVSPVFTELHGVRFEDDYAWMKEKGAPELEAWLRAENAYAAEVMHPHEALRQKLVAELRARLAETDESVPVRVRGYDYVSRSDAAKAYDVHARRPIDGGTEQVLLDLNTAAPGASFVSLGDFEVSDDDRWLAYSLDTTGARDFVLHVKNLGSGEASTEAISHVTSVAWAADNRTLFYTTENDAKRSSKLFRHELGGPVERDVLVFEENDEHFDVSVSRTRSDAFLVLESRSLTSSESRVLDAKKPAGAFRVVLPRERDVEYELDHRGDAFVLRVNDTSKDFRVVSVPVSGAPKKKELVPARPGVPIEDLDVFERFLVLRERVEGVQRLRAIDLSTGKSFGLERPPGDATLLPAQNPGFTSTKYRYGWTSLVTPMTVMERDLVTGETRQLKREPVPGWEPARFETARVEATASDGTKIPITLAYKKGLARGGPLLLRGYGAYGSPNDAAFSTQDAALLDRGVVVAESHLRGGGEFGQRWHDAGRMMNKRTTFTDFIACAEHLVASGWTTRDRLAINGMSAGGLLMGAVLNERPELFKAALVEVPFVDVVSTMLDESLPLTVGEFEEWGNPKDAAAFEYLRSYSPYDNVKRQAYPAMLVRSSYNDTLVLFHEPSKWVAKLRATKTGSNPLLFRMELQPAGHFGRASRHEAIDDVSHSLVFLLWQWGISE